MTDETPVSLSEELSKQFDAAVEAPEAPVTTETTTEAVAAPETTETTPETPEAKAQRERDEKGRFTKKPETAETTAAPEAPAVEQPQTTEAVEIPPEKQREYQSLGLRNEEVALFDKAPPELQNILKRRVEGLRELFTRNEQDIRFSQSMKQTLQPYEATFRSIGVDAPTAVQYLLNADHKLRYGSPVEKLQSVMQIAQSYGVDLTQVQQAAENQPRPDPMVNALQQRINMLESRYIQQSQAAEKDDERRRTEAVDQFFAAHPEAQQLQDEIVYQIAAVKQADPSLPHSEVLNRAYDKAQWASPTFRETLLAKQRAEAEKKAREDAAAKATAAKKAGFDVKGQGGVGIASSQTVSLRDELSSMIPG